MKQTRIYYISPTAVEISDFVDNLMIEITVVKISQPRPL